MNSNLSKVMQLNAVSRERDPTFTFASAVHLLRYGKVSPGATDTVWYSKEKIAQLMQVRYHMVCIALQKYEECSCEKRERVCTRQSSKLADNQVRWLIRKETLDNMLADSLHRRLIKFRT